MTARSHETKAKSAGSGMDPRDVQDRRDLTEYLSQSLSNQYRIFADDDITQTSTYIKSYIIEADNQTTEHPADDWSRALGVVLGRKDPNLLLAFDSSNLPYFIDTRDGRFCVIHSIGRTSETDETINRLATAPGSHFDHAWMPTQFLLGTRYGGQLRGFKFSHQFVVDSIQPLMKLTPGLFPRRIDVTNDGDAPFIQSLRGMKSRLMVSDNHTALEDYEFIQDTGFFGGRRALDWIQFVTAVNTDQVMTHGVYTNGKIIGNGTSIELYLLSVERIRSAYARLIRRIESDFALGWEMSGTTQILLGEPLVFTFPYEVEAGRLEEFARTVFRTSRPFRLFGILHGQTEHRIDVEALDLHSGDPFSAEITREWIRLYLPRGSCGNVVARLYANLQHAIISDIRLTTGNGELLFSEQDAA